MSSRLEPARYRAKILYHTMNVNSVGNPELRIIVLPIGGVDNQPLPNNYTPAPITIFLTMTPNTMQQPQTVDQKLAGEAPSPGWVLQTLRYLGFNSLDLSTLDPQSECAHVFTGKEVVILGSEDEYKGKKRTRWNLVRSSGPEQKMGCSELEALSKRFARVLTASKESTNNSDTPF